MKIEDDSKKILAVRFAIGAPLMLVILYAMALWSSISSLDMVRWYFGFVVTAILLLLLLFLTSRATIPEDFQQRTVEYFIEELLYQDKVYVIPTLCTQCKTPIELNRVR
ncbi:MAG: hypothetical protein ACFFEV_05175 [Candidatus Thorarchaeota archaeon]